MRHPKNQSVVKAVPPVQHKINIANFALGRLPDSTEAIGIVNVDHKVPPEVLAELRAIQAVRQARVVEIH